MADQKDRKCQETGEVIGMRCSFIGGDHVHHPAEDWQPTKKERSAVAEEIEAIRKHRLGWFGGSDYAFDAHLLKFVRERMAQAWGEGVAAGRATDVAAETRPENPYCGSRLPTPADPTASPGGESRD